MTEIKIKTKVDFSAIARKVAGVLPYWAITLAFVNSLLLISALGNSSSNFTIQAQANNSEPQVLGASIDLRGQQQTTVLAPTLTSPINDTKISATSYLVADAETGDVIASKQPDQKQYVASLTKLLTALVAYKQADLSTSVPITLTDQFNVNPVLGLRAGDNVKMLDLFNAMLVGSCNDAALTLANHVQDFTNRDFVGLMNEQAQALGMTNSHFSNPLGFDSPGNYSTASDLLKLVLATQKYSAFTSLGEKTLYSFAGSLDYTYTCVATDKLIGRHREIEAVKTGFTQGAGQAMITKITQNSHSVFVIVLGSKDRQVDTLELEQQIFQNTIWK